MTSLMAEQASAAPAGAIGRRGPIGFNALCGALGACWSTGALTFVAPDGRSHRFVGEQAGPSARLEVRNRRFVRRLFWSGAIGFADGYLAGDWTSPDLAALLTVLSANLERLDGMLNGDPLLRLARGVAHALNHNSRTGSRRNIAAHYDLGDDFYRLWLDPGLNYSSGLYAQPGEDLVAAQRNKHAALAQIMGLEHGQSVLEIGCGWGGFAQFAAVDYGAKVTAITISRAQHAFAARRIQEAGLGERVSVELCDYRDVAGRFDRVASIEMLEAVGEAYWPLYFDRVRELLNPGGRAGVQVITIQEAFFERYRRRPDFIQMHIFPGGMLPSEARLRREAARAGLAWTQLRRFGEDYAETLAEWARRYAAKTDQVRVQGFDARFDRLWRYYLAYCEAGFRTGRTDVVQVGLTRD